MYAAFKMLQERGLVKAACGKKVAVTPSSSHLRRVKCWLKAESGLFLPDPGKKKSKFAACGIFVPHIPTSAAMFTVTLSCVVFSLELCLVLCCVVLCCLVCVVWSCLVFSCRALSLSCLALSLYCLALA